MLSCFLKGVETYGIPRRVRSNKGKENVLVANYMIERGSQIGRDVFDGVLALYYKLLTFMEDNELPDPFNEIDTATLH